MRRRLVGQMSSPGSLGPDTRIAGSHIGTVFVELVDSNDRTVTSEEVLSLWRKEADQIPGVDTLVFTTLEMGPGGTPIEFKLLAPAENMESLEEAVEKAKKKLATYNGIVDIRDDSRPGKWEFQLTVKDKAKALGISLNDLAQTVRSSYYGDEVMRLQRGRHEVKLMVRYPSDERKSLAFFHEIRVRTSDGRQYPLTELADVNVERGYSEINRVNQLRSITIMADVLENVGNARETIEDLQGNPGLMRQIEDVVKKVRTLILPTQEETVPPGNTGEQGGAEATTIDAILAQHPNVSVRWEGQQEQTNESVGSLFVGLAVAVLAMFVLLTVEFRSYVQTAHYIVHHSIWNRRSNLGPRIHGAADHHVHHVWLGCADRRDCQ